VLPSSANAVSVAEYVFAYMIPIVIGVAVMRADELSSFLAAAVIGVTNLIIHTPGWWEESTHKHYHWIFVSTRDHLNHHRKNQRGNYGAPVLHLDRIHAAVGVST
jgi:sterol desaturase/sphingolipid hydroxylase (fatty acid hydroxylase superfamily)